MLTTPETLLAPAVSPVVVSAPLSTPPLRPAWIEIDLTELRKNFSLIMADKPAALKVLSVVKDDAYGHGAIEVAKIALQAGINWLAVSDLEEALVLRRANISAPILMLYERQIAELPWCLRHNLTCCVSQHEVIRELARLATAENRVVGVHLKINTGMNRYGVHWERAEETIELILSYPSLRIEGLISHFAMSDETDKSFALLQLSRFNFVSELIQNIISRPAYKGSRPTGLVTRHICNSGGFLDLPQAHFEMVRMGLLPYGVFPSQVCRRIEGIAPVMTVKAKIMALNELKTGDKVGYSMRYEAPSRRRIAVLPIGYGDGFPRVRNLGEVLIHGTRAPIVGGTAMDAITVDVTHIPQATLGDEAVIMGRQADQEITARDLANWKGSATYDILVGWKGRLTRVYKG